MRLFVLLLTICLVTQISWADVGEKQIKLEDIERDTLIGESKKASDEEKDDNPQAAENTQHIQLTYSNRPQDVYVTPQPGKFPQLKDLRSNIYHLPKVHEEEQTFTVPAKQSLIQPIIGGGQPIQPLLTPQPHYIYIQSPHHHQTPYMPQAHAYVMVPFSHYTSSTPVHHHSVLPTPTPTVITYSHGSTPVPPPHSYQPLKSPMEYASSPDTFKNIETIVPKNKLPSVETTSFQQYYSPGVEFHYTEMVPITKLAYHHPGAPSPIHNYHAQSNLLAPSSHGGHSYNYFISPTTHHSSPPSSSFPPAIKHHQSLNHHYMSSFKNHLPYHQRNYFPTQPLFTPAASHSSSQYTSYPSAHAYNTIQYSVAMPPYDHSKRSTKATASINVKAPKA